MSVSARMNVVAFVPGHDEMEKLFEDIYAHLISKSSLNRNPEGKEPKAGQKQLSLLDFSDS